MTRQSPFLRIVTFFVSLQRLSLQALNLHKTQGRKVKRPIAFIVFFVAPLCWAETNNDGRQLAQQLQQKQAELQLLTTKQKKTSNRLSEDQHQQTLLATQLTQLSQALTALDQEIFELSHNLQSSALDKNPRVPSALALKLQPSLESIEERMLLYYLYQSQSARMKPLESYESLQSKGILKEIVTLDAHENPALQQIIRAYKQQRQRLNETLSEKKDTKHKYHLQLKELQKEAITIQEDLKGQQRFYAQTDVEISRISAQIQFLKQQRQLALHYQRTQGLKPLKGKLEAPVPGQLIQRYGTAGKNLTNPKQEFQGIMLETPKEASVRAIALGKVVFAGSVPGYSKLIIVAHGQRSYSVYGLLQSIAVDQGSYTTQGTLLGKVAQDPVTSKFHTYFEIRDRDHSVDPQAWLKKSYE
ncbi:peptidoglycan DD-metalloendopeptidase family protein [Deltaproteobacteria bacterium TL4]